ncbi:hypothetical protein QTP88_012676 [Uroleucon formosanum]
MVFVCGSLRSSFNVCDATSNELKWIFSGRGYRAITQSKFNILEFQMKRLCIFFGIWISKYSCPSVAGRSPFMETSLVFTKGLRFLPVASDLFLRTPDHLCLYDDIDSVVSCRPDRQ